MVSATQLISSAVPKHGSFQFHPLHTSEVKKVASPLALHQQRKANTIRLATKSVSACDLRSNLYSNSGLRPRRSLRLSRSSPATGCNSTNDGPLILRVCASEALPDDFSSQSERRTPNSAALTVSETPSEEDQKPSAAAPDKERGQNPRDDDNATTMKTSADESQEAAFLQEYKLTEEGTLSAVNVVVGGTTYRTSSTLDRLVAHFGVKAESLQTSLKSFSVRKFISNLGKKKPGVEDLRFNAAMYEPKEGISNIVQWSATELTLQRTQMVRIARDTLFLVWAFTLFGVVRILEAVVAVFVVSPPDFKKLLDVMNALDPLTVASLANAMRKPIVGMLEVDPTNLEEVHSMKAKFWTELHSFYERQWKVMATLGVARLLTLIATHHPAAQGITGRVKLLWDVSMALPIF